MTKPRKPWYRPRNFFLTLLATLVITLVWAVYFTLTAKPGNAVDYAAKLNELARASQPGEIDAPNRWREYEALLENNAKVLNGFVPSGESQPDPLAGEPFVYGFRHEYPQLAGVELLQLKQRAQECVNALKSAGIFDTIDSFVAPSPAFWEVTDIDWNDESIVKTVTRMRRLYEGPLTDCILALHSGDATGAARSFSRCMAIARINGTQSSTLCNLSGRVACIVTFDRIREHFLSHDFSPEVCRAMLVSMENAAPPATAIAINAEHLFMLDLAQRCFTDNGKGDGVFLPRALQKLTPLKAQGALLNALPESSLSNIAGTMFMRKAATTAELNNYFAALRTACEAPDRASRMAALAHAASIRVRWTDRAPVLYLIPDLLETIVASIDDAAVICHGTRLVIAVALYRSVHGSPPEQLEDLTPETLDTLPRDPFAPDGKFRYIKRTPTDDDPRDFILYSVGADGIDDDATQDKGYSGFFDHTADLDHIFNPNPLAPDPG